MAVLPLNAGKSSTPGSSIEPGKVQGTTTPERTVSEPFKQTVLKAYYILGQFAGYDPAYKILEDAFGSDRFTASQAIGALMLSNWDLKSASTKVSYFVDSKVMTAEAL
jgi:hypothetical protein